MSKRSIKQHRNKTFIIGMIIIFIMLIVVLHLYLFWGHQIVSNIYHGKSLTILNNLIQYQSSKPVEHYYALADAFFYKLWILAAAGVVLLTVFRIYFKSRGKFTFEPKYSLRHIVIIYVISLAVRAAFLPAIINLPLAGDETYYWWVPQSLMEGDFSKIVLRPPLWGYLLLIPKAILDHVIAARAFTVVIGAIAPVLIYLLAVNLFNRKTALVAALLYAFYPEHIAYSHYLWSEVLFGVLCLLAILFLTLHLKDQQKKPYFCLCFVAAGLALLTKEYALILFVGLAVTLFLQKAPKRTRKIFWGTTLFLLPALSYSLIVSGITHQIIVLCDAPISNFRQAMDPRSKFEYSFETRNEFRGKFITTLKERSLADTLKNAQQQFYNLWTPNSIPVFRLLSVFRPEKWRYNVSRPWPWVYLIAGYYIFSVFTGLCGLCLSDSSVFKTFSLTSLICLSLTAILAFLCSRFRLPFMFIFVIFAAYLLTNLRNIFYNLKHPLKTIPLIILWLLFAHIVYTKISTFGAWG